MFFSFLYRPKRTTRQHNQQISQLLKFLPLENTPQQESSGSGSSSSSNSFPSPFPSHFTRSQKAALLRLVGQPSCLSTDTPPAEPFPSTSSCRVTKRGGALNLHQANSSQEDDSGNDGDDERDERAAPSRGRDDHVGERHRDNSIFHANNANEVEVGHGEDVGAEGSDGEGSISEGNQSFEESSVSSHPLEAEALDNDDCANEDDTDQIDVDNDNQHILDNSYSSSDCHRDCLGMSSRTRSNCSLKDGESSNLSLSKQNVRFHSSLNHEKYNFITIVLQC